MIGTREISGSLESSVRNFVITFTPSSIPSSTLMSMMFAPFSTCCRATLRASSYRSSLMRRAKAREPVTFVRSPTIVKLLSGRSSSISRPE